MSTSAADASINVPLILGCIEIGIVLNAFLFGIVTVQFFTYTSSSHTDPWPTRFLVWWTFVLDLAHSLIVSELLWKYTVSGFGDFLALLTSQWEYTSSPFFVCATSFPIQIFLALRVKKMAERPLFGNIFFGVIALLGLAQSAMGFYIAGSTTAHPLTLDGYPAFIKAATAWTALSLATDLLITLTLSYTLLHRRTGFKRSDNIITKIVTVTVQSAIPVAMFAVGHMVAIHAGPTTGVHDLFAIPLGRLYTNTLLVTLNSRSIMRDISNAGESSGAVNMVDSNLVQRMTGRARNDRYPLKIHVTQQKDIAMENLSDVRIPENSNDEEMSIHKAEDI